MALLTIIADENIPCVEEYFASIGNVIRVNGRSLTNHDVLNADILLVRSVTKVDRKLLSGSRVRFVATATIGTDHLDTRYLDSQGIGWASAPGCNANSVVEYVISTLCQIKGIWNKLRSGATVGIIGMGNVGTRLFQRLNALNFKCKAYDPLISQNQFSVLTSFADVLNCDVICCHTPLTTDGEYPTQHMINYACLQGLKEGALLINAGRGGAVDNQALKRVLKERKDLNVVLDVWENEPFIDEELLEYLSYGSAHIAGYSLDGKLSGTQMIYNACCQFLNLTVDHKFISVGETCKTITVNPKQSIINGIREAVLTSYDITDDDNKLREICRHNSGDAINQAQAFDLLRKDYSVRREFSHFRIGNAQILDDDLRYCLSALGFECASS